MSLRWKIAQAFEIRWWQHYLRNKPKKNYLQWKRDYWQTFLRDIKVTPKPNSRAIDIGCGPAGIYMVLDELRIDALDPLLNDYREKLEHFREADYPYVKFHDQAFENYQKTEDFDYVFCINAINHVADLAACMDKLVDITRPGGTIILSIDAHNSGMLKSLFRMIPGDILHPHQYDLPEYRNMLTNRNCEMLSSVLYRRETIFNYYILIAKKATK